MGPCYIVTLQILKIINWLIINKNIKSKVDLMVANKLVLVNINSLLLIDLNLLFD